MNNAYQHTGNESYLQEFEQYSLLRNKALDVLSIGAMQHFSELGFPTTKNEEWKYTNVSPILKTEFHPVFEDQFTLTTELIRPFLLAGKNAAVLVFENGRLNLELSQIPVLTNGILIDSLAKNLSNPSVKEHLAKYAPYKTESFIALNTAFVNDGAFIFIPQNIIPEFPIHILHIQDNRMTPTVVYPRILIIVEKNSEIKIVESYHTTGEVNHGFTNSVTEVVVKENAKVELNNIQTGNDQTYHISHTEAIVGKDAVFNTSTITLGGSIVRNNLHIVMNGLNGTAHLYGLFMGGGKQLIDNHTLVDHAVPQCYSNELYKGILDGASQGVFNGKIMVRQDAQKTNAYQSNKNLLLSNNASMNAKPQLEIFADDVKCSHGATTGQLDEESLFYLRSRGIGEELARAFLNIAFAADVINNISIEPLKEKLMHLIEEKLKKGD